MNALEDALVEWYEALAEAMSVYGAASRTAYLSLFGHMEDLSRAVAKYPPIVGLGIPPTDVKLQDADAATAVEDGERVLERLRHLRRNLGGLPLSDYVSNDSKGAVFGGRLIERWSDIQPLISQLRSHRSTLYERQMVAVVPHEYRTALFGGSAMPQNMTCDARGVIVLYESNIPADYASAAADITHLDDDVTRHVINGYRNGIPTEYLRSLK